MNSSATEIQTEENSNPQIPQWIEEKKEAIKNDCPAELQKTLSTYLDKFISDEKTEAEEKLAIQNIETLIDQAKKLTGLLGHFKKELAQAAQSKTTVDTEVALFWARFEDIALDPNQYDKLQSYLKDQFTKHSKETQVINDVNQKINEEIEPEMQSFLPYYFNSKDRGLIYAEMAKLGSLDNVNQYRQKILKAREKREKYVEKKLQDIWAHKTNPEFGQKTLRLIQNKCGDGVFQLPHVQEAQNLVNNVFEAASNFREARTEFENANENYKALTGKNHPDYNRQVETQAPEEEAKTDHQQKAQEVKESKETQIKALLETRRLLKYTMSFWSRSNPELLNDATFSLASGNRRKALLDKDENLPSLETYEAQEAKSAPLALAQDGTKGLWKYRTVDIPSNAEDFTPEKASSLLSKMQTYTDGGGDMMLAMTGIWYIDMAKRGGATAKSVSMNDYLAHIDHLLNSLGQPAVNDSDLA
ncbi:hypothetical protein GW777_05975 [Candidatus Peregrinibacteria bacterium]|nr:hypothetical protein [bacterium]NCQ55834.1 hypothetical protein [Candidatus Parcubacteria bacterium]NCS67901.1 hypothetical protein [Candidatus Peregrinibacteria bacterium]